MIFPKPIKEEYREGSYCLKQKYEFADLYDFYQKNKDGSKDIAMIEDAGLSRDEYELCIDGLGIRITSSCEAGKFRGLTSLRQILQKNGEMVPYAQIQDKPDFANRAYMLEISSGRMPKMELLKEIVDYLAGLKYNEFQLYMENFCFKYSAFPEVAADYACLTPEDIRELDRYCAERFIELIPCQNGFGHMKTWLREERWQHLGVKIPSSTLNPLLPESLELMDGIYGSLLPHFSSDKVNICLDEASVHGNEQLEEACEKNGFDNVFMDWMNKLSDLACEKYGKKTVQFWDDMIIGYPESFHRLPDNAVAMEWGYDLRQSLVMEGRCSKLKEKGIPFYVCPSTQTYSAFTGRFDVASFNIQVAGEVGREQGALGYMLTEWGNFGTPNFFLWSFVPTALAAQYSWNVGVRQNGGEWKVEYIHQAEQYVDENIFNAKVAKKLFQLANFYLLEPERIHGQTICFMMLQTPLSQMQYAPYDLKEIGEEFYFENIIHYVNGAVRRVQEISFAEKYKRQIIVNARMIVLAAEYGLVKVTGRVSRAKYEEICALTDWILEEYYELWVAENYEKGVEEFSGFLTARREELKAFLEK